MHPFEMHLCQKYQLKFHTSLSVKGSKANKLRKRYYLSQSWLPLHRLHGESARLLFVTPSVKMWKVSRRRQSCDDSLLQMFSLTLCCGESGCVCVCVCPCAHRGQVILHLFRCATSPCDLSFMSLFHATVSHSMHPAWSFHLSSPLFFPLHISLFFIHLAPSQFSSQLCFGVFQPIFNVRFQTLNLS